MTTATLEKEFYVETSDKAGVASKLTNLLSDNGKYDFKAIWGNTYEGKGHFYFIPENWTKAKEFLSTSEYTNFREEEVVVAYVDNKPGTITTLTNWFAQENININWFYTTYYNGKPAIVFSCSDNQKAYQHLNK